MSNSMAFKRSLIFFVIISILVHIGAAFLASIGKSAQPEKIEVEVTVAVKNSGRGKYKKSGSGNLIPKDKGALKIKANQYWGIGCYVEVNCIKTVPFAPIDSLLITSVIDGYPAAKSGLIAGDCILSINDQNWNSGVDLAGNKPMDLNLLIARRGRTFTVKLKREVILYE